MAKITIYVPDQEPIKVSFDEQAEITIGRAPDNDLVVDHESMSGHHAKLQQEGDGYILVDLDSTNGSKIDGISTGSGPLSNGTQITFGKVDAVYECEEVVEEVSEEESFGGDGESFVSDMQVDIAETSVKAAGFSNLSPLEKAVEKDQFGKVAMVAGVIAILAALVTFGAAASMKVG
ncbi:MAG: FHA domain-containing protein [Verrucomicrobiales bacterium]|nr:FHA domain-containing protein [Verrucomicrobiales bacterium]